MDGYIDSLYDAVNEISGRTRADLFLALETVLRRLWNIEDGITLLQQRMDEMSDANTSLDQAVADLTAASTAKIAEDQVLVADAKTGLNAAADVAEVEGIVANLNAETAAEQSVTNPPATAPVVAVAPVAAPPAVVPAAPVSQINPIPTATVVHS